MLNTMRNNAQSWLAKLLLGGIILSFALWGVGDYFMGSRVQPVASIDDSPITDIEFARMYERQLNNYRARFGKSFTPELIEQLDLKQTTLQTMINRHIMLTEAAALGLVVPESSLLESLRSNPAFHSAGSFDPERYTALTRNMGYRTASDFEQEQRLSMLIDALQRSIVGGATVSEQEVMDHFSMKNEQRELTALIVDPDSFTDKIIVSDEEARTFYEKNSSNYRSRLKLKMDVVMIDPSADIEVDEAEIVAAYEARKSTYLQPEERQASHILVKVDANADDATRKKARAAIENAQARISKGETFAAIAKEVSEDSSAAKGGDLGFFKRGAMVAPFEKVAFSMAENEISDIVETQFGYHLIQLIKVKEESQQSLSDVHAKLEREVRKSRSSEEAYAISENLNDALGREGSLQLASESMNLSVRHLGPIDLGEAFAEPVFTRNTEFRKRTFAMQAGDPAEIIELANGNFAAVEVLERLEPEVLPFAKATLDVYRDARKEKADAEAKELAERILAEAQAGESFKDLAKKHSQPVFFSKAFKATGEGDKSAWLTREVRDSAFRTPSGDIVDTVITAPQGLVLLQVNNVLTADKSGFSDSESSLRQSLKASKGNARFERWMASVRDKYSIIVRNEVLARF
ncbi:MAG: SurA N-terminal domain-containing protein [Mariprofundaceae bacterium]